jgi:hypothetical protein
MGGKLTQWTEVEVNITINDVVDFIENYADSSDFEEIKAALKNASFPSNTNNLFKSHDGGYIREEKLELLSRAFSKYTLYELEEKLGNKFDLI